MRCLICPPNHVSNFNITDATVYLHVSDAVRAIDPTRYVTSAIPMVKDADEPDYAALDVGGYNYSPKRYDVDHAKYPQRVMVGTESFPTSSFEMWGA